MSLFHLFILTVSIFSVQSRTIQTPYGDIEGYSTDQADIYLGIRYGHIPKRWLPATLPSPWNDTINATEFGPVCPQYGPFKPFAPVIESEDCLFLNIWVPRKGNSFLPVRVWLHGGGYTAGYSNDYDGENLAFLSQSIIITLNYRLGIFGFFPLPDLATRNLGWLDQQLALQWIHKNIFAFGGDRTNVMLFGQSAGGGSTLAHLMIESSWPLYSSIILESSGPFLLPDCHASETVNWKYLETTFPECLSNLTCFQELNTSRFFENLTLSWVSLWPCIGEGSQLSQQPLISIRNGSFNKNASILGGFNSNEGQSVTLIFNQFNMSISSTRYIELAEQYQIPSELTHRYDPTSSDKDYFSAFARLFGDYHLNCPNIYLFDHLSTLTPSSLYVYFFVHPTEHWAFSGFDFSATHLTEIPYVFSSSFALANLTLDETTLSLKMINYFSSFHLFHQPWPSYKNNQTIIILDIGNETMKTQSGFPQELIERCKFVLKYLDSDDCHGYFNQLECLNITHCRWIDDYCDEIPTSSAQQYRLSLVIFVLYLICLHMTMNE